MNGGSDNSSLDLAPMINFELLRLPKNIPCFKMETLCQTIESWYVLIT